MATTPAGRLSFRIKCDSNCFLVWTDTIFTFLLFSALNYNYYGTVSQNSRKNKLSALGRKARWEEEIQTGRRTPSVNSLVD
jgi:hypothetical protein